MSRAYRIRVRESLRRHVRAKDSVSTQLELLGILPAEQMAELLAEELQRRGFQRQGEKLVRQDNETRVSIEPASGTVTVQAETEKVVEQAGEKEGYSYDEPSRGRKKAEKQ